MTKLTQILVCESYLGVRQFKIKDDSVLWIIV